MCGEKSMICYSFQQVVGITPACAGKSSISSLSASDSGDHPRMCGEKHVIKLSRAKIKGSPPHVRGKGPRLLKEKVKARITPACAGKSGIPCQPYHS